MNLDQLARAHAPLQRLLAQSRHFRQLESALKQKLPPNLAPHFRVACIDEDGLLLNVANSMAAARLNMLLPAVLPHLQTLDPHITRIRTRIVPDNPAPVRENRLRISNEALNGFEETADRLPHHPDLAAALRRLAARRKP